MTSTHRKLRKCRKAKRKVKILTLSLKVITVVCAKVLQLCLCDPTYYSLPGSSDHGILQTRILVWVAVSYSRGSSQPRDRTRSLLHLLCWRVSSLPLAPPGKSEPLLLFWFIPLNTYLVYFSCVFSVGFFFFFFKLMNFLSPQKLGLLTSTVSGEQPGRFSGVILNGCFCLVWFLYDKRSNLGPAMLISSRL